MGWLLDVLSYVYLALLVIAIVTAWLLKWGANKPR